ncbi:hypothetical protein PENSPDRAFT_654706 [Peniophora sp. CONT]|nr:hypothetical protein PENSPDRAFT_654706 [Peniophora sp. CONT]
MDAYRARHEDPSSQHEPLLLISFHVDNLGVSFRVALEGDVLPDNRSSLVEVYDGPTQPLRLEVSLPADMKTGYHTRKRFSTLVRAVAAVPYQPHILHFDGNLPTFDTTLYLKLAKCTVGLVLGQLCDVEALVTLLHTVPPPAFSRLTFMEVTADLPEPEATFRQLADALEDAYLAKEQSLWERLRLYYRRGSRELLHFRNVEEE